MVFIMAKIILPILSPLQGINRVTARETQGSTYCWDAFNCLPFDAWGKARVAQRFGVGRAWSALGSTQIQGMLPVNFISYSSTGNGVNFPIASIPGTPVSIFGTTSTITSSPIPTGSTGVTPGSGVIGGAPPTGQIGGTPATSSTAIRRPNTGPGGSQAPGGPSGPGGSGGPGTYTGPGAYGGPTSGSTTGGTPGRFGGPGGGGGSGSGTPSGGATFGAGGTSATAELTMTRVLVAGFTATVNAKLGYFDAGGSGTGFEVLFNFDDTPTAHNYARFFINGLQVSNLDGCYGAVFGNPLTSTDVVLITVNCTTSGSTSNIVATLQDITRGGGISTLYSGAGPIIGSTGYDISTLIQNPAPTGGFPGSYLVTLS